jgi:endonuclease/exonuclease/phosphatase family metal-dependent hydrolase
MHPQSVESFYLSKIFQKMRKIIALFIICLSCVSITVKAQDTIRIMTFNIDQGLDTSLQVIGEIIKSYHPDFVALQEVDMFPHRSYAPHQHDKNFIAELCYYADMQGVFGKAWDHPGGWDFGDAILSKHSFTKSENFSLPHIVNTEPRQLLLIHSSVNGLPICFACTHLSYENKTLRAMQIRKIKQIMKKQKEKIQFVCGDFNSDISENLVSSILNQWKDALPEGEGTFSSNREWHYMEHKYDYILYNYKKKKNIEVIYSTIDCDDQITDHCIGVTDIIIK